MKDGVRTHWIALLAALALLSLLPKLWMSWTNYVRLGVYDQPDFDLYYFAFDTVLHRLGDISRLYQHSYLIEQMRLHGVVVYAEGMTWFGYPPPFAVFLAPFALLPLQPAKLLWLVMSALMLGASLAMLTRLCADPAGVRRRSFGIVLVSLAGLSAPVYMEFQFGQANSLVLFLLCATFYARYVKGSSWLAGLPLGLAILFKLTPALIPVYYLLRRDWRLAVSTAGVCVAGLVATACVTGWKLIVLYPLEYLPAFTQRALTFGDAPWNSSLRGALMRVAQDLGSSLPTGVLSLSVAAYSLALLAFIVVVTLRRAENRFRDMGVAVMLPLMLSPVIEEHHMVAALIPLAVTLAALWSRHGGAPAPVSDAAGSARVGRAPACDVGTATATALLAGVVAIYCAKPLWLSYTASLGLLLGAVLQATRQSAAARIVAGGTRHAPRAMAPLRDSAR